MRRCLCSTLSRAVSREGVVSLRWSDGSAGRFHHAWLRDHCPQSRHPVSGQRTFELHDLPAALSPERVALADGGRALSLQWPTTPGASAAHTSTFDADWLRRACYDERADEQPAAAAARSGAGGGAVAVPWHASELTGRVAPACTWSALHQPGGAGDAHALACLTQLRERGFVRVSECPRTEAATAQLARTLGRMQGTFYGDGVWDTAPRDAADVIDTAYSNVELPLHTDGTYLSQQPGLQLFVCAEQAAARADRPLDGATKLADGLMAARVLREQYPATWAYFCRVALPFMHVEGEVATDLTRADLT
jgi:hypothetical protein